jgi:uncharacterized lipoprotein YddW (UPF0748 family)
VDLRWLLAAGLILLAGSFSTPSEARERASGTAAVPAPAREFRGVWVATVDNIDWPSKPGLTTEQQQAELIALLDRAAQLKLNAIVFQVRPACDAFYESKHEPWSEFLTGQMGKAPEPYYDPLAFAVEEAHRRGLELHAWFNPYRARHPAGKSEISTNHISKTQPDLVKQYGKYLWLDPGEKAVQDHSLKVILDVVSRYDIDGVHMDDYFYPYKERDAAGQILPFPDEPSWEKYTAAGGLMSRDDWRRENVNQFVKRLYDAVKAKKRRVRVGISPFGIYRPGYPPQIQGFDQYAELYADARKWLVNGWVDYFSPQLYWKIEQTAQSYPVLLEWWTGQNPRKRHLWPGNYTSRVGTAATAWPAEEIANQVRVTRSRQGAGGNIHFSMKALMENRAGLSDLLASGLYSQPALVPASPWLDSKAPAKPKVTLNRDRQTRERRLTWAAAGSETPWLWVVQVRSGREWTTEVLPGEQKTLVLDVSHPAANQVAVSEVDRCGNQGPPVIVAIKAR